MFAITGITGKVGGAVARALLDAHQPVRAVVRDARKGDAWAKQGCAVALADIQDSAALTAAFQETEGVFVLVPPNFDPAADFSEARATAAVLRAALEKGVIPSFLQPLEKAFPMVATADIGRTAARLLRETWNGRRVIELEGPRRVTPNEIAATFARLLGREVRMEVVPRNSWDALFRSQGMKNPIPRIQMLDGFNEGWIEFEDGATGSQKGTVPLATVLTALIENER